MKSGHHLRTICLILSVAFLSTCSRSQDRGLQDLQAARSRWEAEQPTHYRIVIEGQGGGFSCREDFEVLDGEVIDGLEHRCKENGVFIEFFASAESAPRVEGLFRGIEATIVDEECGPNGCECDGVESVEVDYDERLGYPTHIRKYYRKTGLHVPQACTMIGSLLPTEFEVLVEPITE